uniref:Uncharacterized protein n=1 Tax=Arundo donax TaxID=35708 RepID=A0A0A8YZD6_ARUDO
MAAVVRASVDYCCKPCALAFKMSTFICFNTTFQLIR